MPDTDSIFPVAQEEPLEPRRPKPSTEASVLTLADVLLMNVVLSWNEAVALVLETLHSIPSNGTCPSPTHVALSSVGETRVLSREGLNGAPVPHAAQLLKQLIGPASAPAALRALIEQESGDKRASHTLEDFARALAYFERPNRRADVATVHARASVPFQKLRADQELERLRAKTVLHDEPSSVPKRSFSARLGARGFELVLVVLSSVVIGISALTLVALAVGPPRSADIGGEAAPTDVALGWLQTTSAQARQLVDTAFGTGAMPTRTEPPAPSQPPQSNGSRAARREPTATRNPGAAGADAGVLAAPRDVALPTESPRSRGRTPARGEWIVSIRELTAAEVGPAGADHVARPLDESLPLFSGDDEEVRPAVIVKPQLPSQADDSTPVELASFFDLVISEAGDVEQVRLVSPGSRFADRMLVSAAKAWRFQPALKDGQPVRYRLRLRITP